MKLRLKSHGTTKHSRLIRFSCATDSFEFLFIRISKTNIFLDKDVILGVCYRPPKADLDDFLLKLAELLENIPLDNNYFYLAGDFNLNLLEKESNHKIAQFFNLFLAHGLIRLITKPTRCTPQSNTLIDNIFMNNLKSSHSSYVLFDDTTDHFPLITVIPEANQDRANIEKVYRPLSPRNMEMFLDYCQKEDWGEILNINCAKTYSMLQTKMNKIFNQSFPWKTAKLKYKYRLPWVNENLAKEIKIKNKLYRKFLKAPTQINLQKYKGQKRLVKQKMNYARRKYYNDKLSEFSPNPRKYWKVIKEIMDTPNKPACPGYFIENNQIINESKEIASRFNEFVIHIGPKLASVIPKSTKSYLLNLQEPNPHSIFLLPTAETEVKNLFYSLRNSAAGWDELNKTIISLIFGIILPILVHIINLSLATGIMPDELKMAKVLPLFKSENCHIFNNYRPISILPVLSKVFEKNYASAPNKIS